MSNSIHVPADALTYKDKYFFCTKTARRGLQFFEEYLRHSKGEKAGSLFLLEDWQKEIVAELLGWLRIDNGMRRYRLAYIEVPRKNGKSTLGAGFGDYLLTADNEPGAEVYSAAADKEQAAIVFREASQMILQCPELNEMCDVQKNAIVVPSTVSSYKVLSADAFTKHGINAHGILFDELHSQPNRELWDVLTTSVGSRRQPLILAITTAGFDKFSVCYELHQYAKKVRDGIIDDPTTFVRIFAADEKDDWKDPAVWAKANPNLGVSVKLEFLENECKKAQEIPAYENTFKRLFLNIWTEQETRWMPVEHWDASDKPLANEDDIQGSAAWIGLDLASTSDIAAMVGVVPLDDGTFNLFPRFYIPADKARERSKRDRVPYTQWIDEGLVFATPGNVIDYDFIRRDIVEWAEKFDVHEVAYDPWSAMQIALQLQHEGLTVVPFRQGFATMSGPTKQFGAFVSQKKIRHGGNPVLRWMFSNVAVDTDAAGNIKPSKKKAIEKIDGIVASIMGVGRATLSPDAQGSVYSSRGMVTL